jgi:hypothetical protein
LPLFSIPLLVKTNTYLLCGHTISLQMAETAKKPENRQSSRSIRSIDAPKRFPSYLISRKSLDDNHATTAARTKACRLILNIRRL